LFSFVQIIASLLIASATAFPFWHSHHHTKEAEIKNGKVVDTPEVQHAKAEHFAAVAKAGGYATGHDSGDSYAHDYSHNEHSDIKYDGKYGYHYPTIKNGVPVEPEAVQHARAAHLAKVAETAHHYTPEDKTYDNYEHHQPSEEHYDEKYDGKYGYHYPTIKNGVPVEPEAVQHARAAHLAKVAEIGHHYAPAHQSYDNHYYYHGSAVHNGAPIDTPEVQHAKAVHFAAVAEAEAKIKSSSYEKDDGEWDEKKQW
jgi:hypothetical protein